MSKVLRREEMEKGDIVLELHEGKKRNIWHMRIRAMGQNQYIRKSTFTHEFGIAAQMAQKEFDDMRERMRKDLPAVEPIYKNIYSKWLESIGKHRSSHRQKSIHNAHNTYLLPYFGKRRLSEITEQACSDYWKWRMDYWTTGPGKDNKKVKHFVETPGGNTLANERQSLLQVLRWAKEMRYIDYVPSMKPPIKRPKKKEIARPAFTFGEYEKVIKWARQKCNERGFEKPKYANDYGQAMFYNFVRFGFATGMRPNEIFSLQWKQIEQNRDIKQGYTKINVPSRTKTGKRSVIAFPDAYYATQNIKGFSKYTEPDDYVFTTWNGNKVRDYAKQFKNMLIHLGLEHDMHGDWRTPYSMRHSYITFRLLHGQVLVQDLARNCGNSVDEITQHYDHVLNEQKADELTRGHKIAGATEDQQVTDEDLANLLKHKEA